MIKGYTTPVEVCTILGWDISDETTMAEVNVFLEFAERAVDQHCHTQFDWEPGDSKTFDGTGNGMIALGFYLRKLTKTYILDATGARSVEVTDAVPEPTPLKKGSAYRWIERRQLSSSVKYAFPLGRQNVEVVGDWGFKQDEMPADVRMAIAYAVKYFTDLRMYNDLVETDSGLGRAVVFRTDKFADRLPQVSQSLLSGWINSVAMNE